MRVVVVAQSCGVRALNARTCEQERSCRVRGGPRARRTSPEGAFSPRARRTSPEGAFSPRARWGRSALPLWRAAGGHQGRDRVVCAFWFRGLVCVLHFLQNEVGFPRLFRGPVGLSPTSVTYHLKHFTRKSPNKFRKMRELVSSREFEPEWVGSTTRDLTN
jgi:hypothetical protein